MAPRGTKRAQQAAAAAATAGTPSSSSVPVALPRVHPPAAPSSAPAKSSRRSRRKQAASPAPSDSRKSSIVSTEPTDRLSPLSSELLALILHHLSPPASRDLPSLVNFALVSKTLLPHVRAHMYRELRIDTRVQAHSLHRSLHGNDTSNAVRAIEADVGVMAKTSSQWMGWFLFHSMHSLCGIIGVCRSVLSLTLYLPSDASAWTQSLCASLVDLKLLHTLTKDMDPSTVKNPGAGASEGMDVGWKPRASMSMWSVTQFIKPLTTLKSLRTLRLCGISSDSSTSPPAAQHSLKLAEVVLIEVNITNSDLLHLLGNASSLKKLTLWRSSLLSKRGLTHLLKKCPNLVELRIGGSWFGAKEEDDTNFPLDTALPLLPSLRLIHCSGSLISPSVLLHSTTNLTHLLVANSPSFTPQAIHSALVKMRCGKEGGPPPVKRLTLPEMREGGVAPNGEVWSEQWCFTVKATAEAKGVELDGSVGGEGSDSD